MQKEDNDGDQLHKPDFSGEREERNEWWMDDDIATCAPFKGGLVSGNVYPFFYLVIAYILIQ